MPVPGGKSGWPLSADAVVCLIAEVVSKPGAGSRFTGRSVSLRARGLDFSSCALGSCGQRPPVDVRRSGMLTRTQDDEEIIERVAALDIGKAELTCCLRVPDEDHRGRRLQEVRAYPTLTRSLLGMADRLACLGVTRVVMEATADYWKPVFYLLEAAGFDTWLVNAKDV